MNWLKKFMYGRYGSDPLNMVILVAAIVLTFVTFPYSWLVSLACIVVAFFRMFSKDIYRRRAENDVFVGFFKKIGRAFKYDKNKAEEKKYFRFYKCPNCSQQLRVPKGKGKIMITCPQCRTKFQKKT